MFCTHCGTRHQPDANFCTECGAPAPAASAQATRPAPEVVAQPSAPLVSAPPAAAADLAVAAHEQSAAALHAIEQSTPVPAAPATHDATLPGLTNIGLTPMPVPAAAPQPAAYAPAPVQPAPQPAAPYAAAPVPPYATPAPPMPPVPSLHPSVVAAPRPTSTAPDVAGFMHNIKLPGTADGGEVDAAQLKKIAVIAGAAVSGIIMLVLIIRFFDEPSVGGFFALVFVGLLATLAFVGFIAYRAHQQETNEARTLASLPPSVQHVVAQMEPGAQAAFFNEYERYKKRIVISYVLLWLCGAHYFYLRQPLLNAAYWFTGAAGGFWYWFDVFRMPSLVRAANEQTARQALQTLHVGAVFAQMPSAPAAMVQPVPPAPTYHPAPGPGLQDR